MKKTFFSNLMAVFLLCNFMLWVNLSSQSIPYVYSSENTGSGFAPPPLPTVSTAPTVSTVLKRRNGRTRKGLENSQSRVAPGPPVRYLRWRKR